MRIQENVPQLAGSGADRPTTSTHTPDIVRTRTARIGFGAAFILPVVLVVAGCAQIQVPAPSPAPPATRPPSTQPPPTRVKPPAPFEIRLDGKGFVPVPARPDWEVLLRRIQEGRVHAVVQLGAIPDEDTRAALARAGIDLGQPLTGAAYLAAVSGKLDRNAAVLTKLRWVGPHEPEAKLAAAFSDARATEYARRIAGRVEVVVTLFAGTDADAAVARAKQIGADVVAEVRAARLLVLSLPSGRERELANIDAIFSIEPATPGGANESERARQFIGADVGAIPAGRPDGTGVRVGVLEGGHAQTNHTAFGNRVQQGDAGNVTNNFHSTMTMGMILGSGAGSVAAGAATANQWRGIAPAATGFSYNFLTTATPVADYIGDVTEAVQNDIVHLMNNSWGTSGCAAQAYGAYVGRAPFLDGVVKGSLGRPVPIVFAAGNERAGFFNSNTNANDTSCITATTAPFANYGTINHPKAAKNLIAVGAIDSANNAMSSYSSWGPTLDGRLKPDVVAAGHHNGSASNGVTSITNAFGQPTGAANQQAYRTPIFDPNFVYGWYSQTSSAAAEVSGGLALMIDGWRRAFPGRADPLPSTLRAALVHNATDLVDANTTWYRVGPDYASGYGLVRLNDSVASLERGDAIEGSVAHGKSARYFVTVAAGAGPLRITLAWDDEPAIDGANPALINDLDLVVTDPSGTRRFPWTLDPANPAADAVRTAENHVDNLEQVLVDAPAAGLWIVDVRGTSVATGRQNFSLVTRNGFTRQPSDLILALDISDSMNSPAVAGALQKIEILRRSVRLLLETWNLHAIAQDRIGFVTFNSNVTTTPNTVPALQPLQANLNALIAAAGGLTASGCTALGGSLQVAFGSFDPNSANKKSILVVTDGMQSANPFVGEAGTPARLMVQTFPLTASLPFGAFFCTNTAATGPGGAAIVPDNIAVADHGAEIHAIGVGVNGVGFQQLVGRLASESSGLSHFTTTPDSNLDLLYINDLVRALKSNTLEVIDTANGSLAAGANRDLSFPVNGTSRSVTVVLSWQGASQTGAVGVQMRAPSGAALVPARTRQGTFFTVMRFDLGGPANPGTWTLRLSRAGAAVTYQVSIIADENCFHYDLQTPRAPLRAGEALLLTAQLSGGGRALPAPLSVRAQIAEPVTAPGNLLTARVPRTRAAQKYLAAVRAGQWGKLPSATAVIEAAVAELLRDPVFHRAAGTSRTRTVVLEPLSLRKGTDPVLLGETRFAAGATALTRAGAYPVTWEIAGDSSCGPVQRQEFASIVVGLGKFDVAASRLTQVPGPRGTVIVTIKPADAFGNLLGPGMAGSVRIDAEGAKPASGVIDLLDGTYLRAFAARGKGEKLPLKVSVNGEELTPGR